MKGVKYYISGVLFYLIAGSLFASELQENFVPIKPLGMGGAFTAISNDENAVWTNPAGIARARKARNRKRWFLTKFPNLGVGVNSRAKKIHQTKGSDAELAEAIAESGDLGEENPYWENIHMFPLLQFDYSKQAPGAIGAYTNITRRMFVSEDDPAQTDVKIISDTGGVANFTWTNRTNRVNLGINLRYIVRYAYEDKIPTEEIKNKKAIQARFKDSANSATGFGIDAGAMYTFADFWFPTFGIAIFNLPTGCKKEYLNPHTKTRQTVCGNLYRGKIENEEALSVIDPTDIRVGISITPRLSRKMALRIGLDAHHIYLPSGASTIGLPGVEAQKMLHGGIELFWGNPLLPSPFSLHAGMGQGFLSTGFSVRLPYWSIDFATYGVDVSSEAKPIEDRRTVAGTSIIW